MPDYFEAGVVQQTDSSVPELPQAYLNGCLSVSDRMSPGKPALIHASQFDICSVLELEEIRDSMLHLWLSDRSNFGRSLSSNPGQSMEVDVSSLSGKRVLVTGGGGFIGSHLAERLVSEGAHTRALVHYRSDGSRGWLEGSLKKNEIEVIAGDVCDSEIVVRAMRQTDVVFHLAALIGIPYSYDAPRSYVHTNVTGTLNVLQAARDLEIQRVVHTSTSEVYGSAQYVPIDEKHPLQAQSPYSASKIGAEKLAEAFYLSFELPVVTVRPFNTFGPRQSARAVIPTIISQCLKSRSVKIGRLHPTRDLNFVQNTVDGILRASVSPTAVGQTVNLGSGSEISIGSLASTIVHLIGGDIPIETNPARVRPQDSEVDRLLADNTAARELLDWTPQVSLKDGLSQTIDWIRDNLSLYRTDEYVV